MTRRLNGILKYAKKRKKFQGGGVTFTANPAMYNPEEDFYMKSAHSRYSAGNKSTGKKGGKTNIPKAEFLKTGPQGTRNFYNDKLQGQLSIIQQQVAENGEGWLTGAVGVNETTKLARMQAEFAANLDNVGADRKEALKELSTNDKTSLAFVNGAYVVKDKKGKLTKLTPGEYYKDPSKWQRLTVERVFDEYDSMPIMNSSWYTDLGQIKSGNKFFNEDIMGMRKSYKAIYNGEPMTAGQLNKTYSTLLTTGKYDSIGNSANLDTNLESLKSTIFNSDAARNSLDARIWATPGYVKMMQDAPEEDKATQLAVIRNAEIFKLAYIQGKGASVGGDKENPGSGGKIKMGQLGNEAYGLGLDYDLTFKMTDYYSHLDKDSQKEILTSYAAFKPVGMVQKMTETNNVAEDSAGKKSANLQHQTEIGRMVNFDSGITPTGQKLSQGLGMTDTEFKKNAIIKDPGMSKVFSMPAMSDGSTVPGFSEYMNAFKEMSSKTPYKARSEDGVALKNNETRSEYRLRIHNQVMKKHAGSAAAQGGAWLLKYQGGVVPTKQKMIVTTLVYLDRSEADAHTDKFIKEADDSSVEQFNKMNPGVDQSMFSGTFASSKGVYEVPVIFQMNAMRSVLQSENVSTTSGQIDSAVASYSKDSELTVDDILAQIESTK